MLLQTEPADLDPALTLGLVLLVAFVAMGGLLVYLASRLRQYAEGLAALERLDGIDSLLRQMASRGDELDLRRIEHVLIDIRDGQARLEERLARQFEAQPSVSGDADDAHRDAARMASLSERVTTRLLSMGFERIEVLTPQEDLEALALAAEGEVVVEARRGGALHKGRVLIQQGSICDVRLRSSYEAFP